MNQEPGDAAKSDPALEVRRDETLWRAYIGKNAEYYTPRFIKYTQTGSSFPSWHWPAFFIAFWWALYRNAWAAATLFFFLPWLLFVPEGLLIALLGKDHDNLAILTTIFFWALMYALPALLANGLYFRLTKKRVAEARALSSDPGVQIAYLSDRGRTSSVPILAFAFVSVVAVAGILAAIAVPAYQDYVVRSRLIQALSVGEAAEQLVGNYWQQNGKPPTTDELVALVKPTSAYVKKIEINSVNGMLTLTLSAMMGPVAGKSLYLIPSANGDRQVAWRCTPGDIPPKYLPITCRSR